MKKIILVLFCACALLFTAQARAMYVKNESGVKQANTNATSGDIFILQKEVRRKMKIQLSFSQLATQLILFKS